MDYDISLYVGTAEDALKDIDSVMNDMQRDIYDLEDRLADALSKIEQLEEEIADLQAERNNE